MQQTAQPQFQPMPTPRSSKRSGLLAPLATLLVGVALLAILFVQRQNILDWWALRGYTPPASVVAIADEISLTDKARKVFYVNKPLLLDSDAFNDKCPDAGGEKTIVLGCYHGDQRGIYLYDVTDGRLDGIRQVTAAHELLHAEYDRLNSSERSHINALLEDYYQNSLKDQRLLDIIDAYKISEPNDVVNEMHSIFATEIADLPAELETYYSRYFTDRKKVIAYAQAYQNEFTSRQQQVAAYDTQLAGLKAQITDKQQLLESQNRALSSERVQLDELRAAGDVKAYSQGAASFNQKVTVYNQGVAELKSIVAEHNAIVDKRNAIALEQQELSQAIDSHLESL
ncbi:MAG: hypothetical protein WBP26_03115 [Candidatus Saccharimonadales bacterium]